MLIDIFKRKADKMKIKVNFFAELVKYFGKSIEIEIKNKDFKVIDLIEKIIKKTGEDARKYILSCDDELKLIIMSDSIILKLNDEIKEGSDIDIFPILAGG